MYLRMTSGTENLPCAYAYIEFTNQPTVPIALQNNGIEFKGRCLRFVLLFTYDFSSVSFIYIQISSSASTKLLCLLFDLVVN